MNSRPLFDEVPKRKADQVVTAVDHHIRMSLSLSEMLRIHASIRKVAQTRLIRDILTLWVLACTDPEDQRFNPKWIGCAWPELPNSPYPHYLDGLGYEPEDVSNPLPPDPK